MMDYDIERASVDAAVALTPGHRGPDRSRRCIARAGSRCARWCPRAGAQRLMDELYDLGARGHPAHRHPCLPTLTPVAGPCPLPHTWRPLGVAHRRHRLFGAMLAVVVRVRLVHLRRRDPREVHLLPARHADRPRRCSACRLVLALVRSRVVADRRPAGRGQRLPPPRVRVGRRSSPPTCPPGAPWVDPRPRRRHHRLGAWASRAPTAPAPRPPSASCAPSCVDAA